MLHYNNNSEESSKCLSKLYELLVNILIQEGITNDYSLHEGIERNSNSGSAEEGD